MEGYHEHLKFINQGIIYPFKCHTQETMGKSIMAPAHYHEYIEILYCLSGSFKIFLDGQAYVFTKGDMVVINAMEVHYILSDSDKKNKYIVIRFEPELLYTTSQSLFEAKYVLPFTTQTSTHQKTFTRGEIKDTFIPSLIKKISLEDKEKSYGFELAIRTHIGGIFLWILRSWNNKGLNLNLNQEINKDTLKRLQIVFDYVEQHYDEPITIDRVAKICTMSYSYFSRFFKSTMNRNFTSYVNFIRVSNAERLLITTDLNITEIALRVGFSTSSYFIEQFKSYKNITPKQFRLNFKTLDTIN